MPSCINDIVHLKFHQRNAWKQYVKRMQKKPWMHTPWVMTKNLITPHEYIWSNLIWPKAIIKLCRGDPDDKGCTILTHATIVLLIGRKDPGVSHKGSSLSTLELGQVKRNTISCLQLDQENRRVSISWSSSLPNNKKADNVLPILAAFLVKYLNCQPEAHRIWWAETWCEVPSSLEGMALN